MTKKPKTKGFTKAVRTIQGTMTPFLCILDLGRQFDQYEDGQELNGYTLAFCVGALGREIVAELESAGFHDRGSLIQWKQTDGTKDAAEKAGSLLQDAIFVIGDLTAILDELSHSSDNWEPGMHSAVGVMTYTMALRAARQVERAAELLGDGPGMGFNDRSFDEPK